MTSLTLIGNLSNVVFSQHLLAMVAVSVYIKC